MTKKDVYSVYRTVLYSLQIGKCNTPHCFSPLPPHLVSYTNALLASQDRRHPFMTLSCCYLSLLNSLLQEGGRSPSDDGRPGSEESGVRGGGVSPRPRPSPSPTGSSSSRSMSPAVGQPREGQSGYLFIKHVSSVANPRC